MQDTRGSHDAYVYESMQQVRPFLPPCFLRYIAVFLISSSLTYTHAHTGPLFAYYEATNAGNVGVSNGHKREN